MELIIFENELVQQSLKVEEVFKTGGLDPVLNAIKGKVAEKSKDLDPSTAKGRAEYGTLCRLISSSKVFIDEAGKKYVAELKNKIKPIDAERKKWRDELDTLKEEVNKPRADWEAAEKARIESEELARQLEKDHAEALEMNEWLDRQKEIERREAELAKAEAERKAKEEAERLEKERIAREEQIRKEAEEKARIEVEREKQEAIRKQQEAEKREKEAAERAERDRIAAEERAKVEKEMAIREAERKAKEEADRREEERLAKEKAEREEADRKAANKKHRTKINAQVVEGLMDIGISAPDAGKIVDAVSEGKINHMSIQY